jgi:hypothetical protein
MMKPKKGKDREAIVRMVAREAVKENKDADPEFVLVLAQGQNEFFDSEKFKILLRFINSIFSRCSSREVAWNCVLNTRLHGRVKAVSEGKLTEALIVFERTPNLCVDKNTAQNDWGCFFEQYILSQGDYDRMREERKDQILRAFDAALALRKEEVAASITKKI